MCGDTHCWSCGPAQGNWRCPICGAWADDTCEHFDDNGNLLPSFEAQVRQIEEDQRVADDLFAKDLLEEAALAERWRDV